MRYIRLAAGAGRCATAPARSAGCDLGGTICGMALERTTVYVDADDLAVIKESAAREGVSEAEIIRQAVHRAALARQTWDEPFFSRTYEPVSGELTDTGQAVEEMWEEKARQYRATKGDAA